MNFKRTGIDDFMIVEVSGIVDSNAAGTLMDALVECVGDGWKLLIVDFSGASHATRAGIRGLVVAAKLLKNSRGELRICGANAATGDLLRGLGFHHLLKCDPTVEHSMLALSGFVVEPNTAAQAA